MAALALTSQRFHHEPLHQSYRSLRARGKPFKVAIVAIMRKLVVALNAMVKNDLAWVHDKGP
jgi:transposase